MIHHLPEDEVPWSSYLTMAPNVRSRIKGYEALAAARLGSSRPAGCLVNINQNPEHMPTISTMCPALLCGSRLWGMSLSREILALEHLELQGYVLFMDNPEKAKAHLYAVPESMRNTFLGLSAACVKKLAGNGMHLSSIGAAHVFTLIMMEPVSRTML